MIKRTEQAAEGSKAAREVAIRKGMHSIKTPLSDREWVAIFDSVNEDPIVNAAMEIYVKKVRDELTEANSKIAALEALVSKWIDVKANPKWLNGIDPYRTVLLFDNGKMLFYNQDWHFSEAIAAFELPEALTPNKQ